MASLYRIVNSAHGDCKKSRGVNEVTVRVAIGATRATGLIAVWRKHTARIRYWAGFITTHWPGLLECRRCTWLNALMPELPEVETMRRGVSGVVGSRIAQVVRPRCRLRPISIEPDVARFRRRVVGRGITAVDRLGKRLVLRLEGKADRSPEAVVIEPRMTGLVLVADPPDREHLRFGLELTGGRVPELWFWDRRGLGSVRLVTAADFEGRYGLDRIGPDALTISAEEMRDRLAASRREIKVALLDQRALAGVGNLYASEILHTAGVHPRRRCDKIGSVDWQRIHAAMREVLEDAIRHEGSTLADGTYRNALNNAGNYQHRHRVYDRADEPCGVCATPIIRLVQAQRSTFFCPACQPLKTPKRSPPR